MFYRIEGTGIRLAGTLPALTAAQPRLPAWLYHVADQAEQLVFAADPTAADPAAELLPANQSLSVLAFYPAVVERWRGLGIPDKPGRLRPWAAAARIVAAVSGLQAPGVEALLLPEARRRQPAPIFLEAPGDRAAAENAVSLDEQLARLEHAVTQPEQAAAFDAAVHAAWQVQNIDTVAKLLETERQAYPQTCASVLDTRSRAWLPRLSELAAAQRMDPRPRQTLVIVGALHLCGEAGVVTLLAHAGHQVTRML